MGIDELYKAQALRITFLHRDRKVLEGFGNERKKARR